MILLFKLQIMSILDIVLVLLLLGWIGGFAFQVAGALIHILLVIFVIGLIFRILSRAKGAVKK